MVSLHSCKEWQFKIGLYREMNLSMGAEFNIADALEITIDVYNCSTPIGLYAMKPKEMNLL
jgi:hypothetical protein